MEDDFLFACQRCRGLCLLHTSLETYGALLDSMLVESRPLDYLRLQVVIHLGDELERKNLRRVSRCIYCLPVLYGIP